MSCLPAASRSSSAVETPRCAPFDPLSLRALRHRPFMHEDIIASFVCRTFNMNGPAGLDPHASHVSAIDACLTIDRHLSFRLQRLTATSSYVIVWKLGMPSLNRALMSYFPAAVHAIYIDSGISASHASINEFVVHQTCCMSAVSNEVLANGLLWRWLREHTPPRAFLRSSWLQLLLSSFKRTSRLSKVPFHSRRQRRADIG